MKMTREFFIPKDAAAITRDGINAVVYIQDSKKNGKPAAMGFSGKAAKPAFNYYFNSEERRDAYVNEFFDSVAKTQAVREQRKAERVEFKTALVVGDILVSSWGYEQTNVDFYQVVEVKPSRKAIVIREICSDLNTDAAAFMSGTVTPIPDNFKGKPMLKRVQPGDYVRIESFANARKWDGKPKYCSWYA